MILLEIYCCKRQQRWFCISVPRDNRLELSEFNLYLFFSQEATELVLHEFVTGDDGAGSASSCAGGTELVLCEFVAGGNLIGFV